MADIEKLDLRMAGERCDDAVMPCPFCGSKNIAYGKYEHTAGRRYAIVCMNCMAQIDPGWAQSWGAVQEMWNRRADHIRDTTKKVSNADRIRGMSDEEIASYIREAVNLGGPDYCKRLPECDRLLDTVDGIPDEDCRRCLLDWLRKPAEDKL